MQLNKNQLKTTQNVFFFVLDRKIKKKFTTNLVYNFDFGLAMDSAFGINFWNTVPFLSNNSFFFFVCVFV